MNHSAQLFRIYITDLVDLLESQSAFFADNGKFFSNPLINSSQMQDDLNCIHEWTVDWIYNLNASKCSVLHLGNANPKLIYSLNSNPHNSVDSQKDLGVLFTSNLKGSAHNRYS